ncbi:DnaJ domain protein, partial [Oesophagostomum dentatum]
LKYFAYSILVLLFSKDYYQILGVQRDATQRQIKIAYYQLSKKYHPDTAGRSEGTEAKFIEISEAYECLKDPERRRIYDNEISGSGGRYTGDPYGFTDFRHFSERRTRAANGGNPFFSQRYTQQEYERVWFSCS